MTIQPTQPQKRNSTGPSTLAQSGQREILVFTGTHKTGSTALHRYLTANRRILAELGVRYEITRYEGGFFGNGQPLFELLYLQQPSPDVVDKKLEEYLDCGERAICLSEDLTRFGPREWEMLSSAFVRLGIRPRILTYVRNVSSYYSSGHSETAKAGLTSLTFEKFCAADHYSNVIRSLETVTQIFGTAAMTVCHYESIASAIERPLLELLGLDCPQLDRSVLALRSNRSLIDRELELMLCLNAATGGQHAGELTQLFTERRPEARRRPQFSPAVLAIMEARHAKDVEWVNLTFFGGANALRISGEDMVSERDGALDLQLRSEIDNDFIAWCLKQMKSSQQQGVDFVSSRLMSIDWVSSAHASIPKNFDPVAYLILNNDLLNSQEKPFEHYIRYGQFEKRRMSW